MSSTASVITVKNAGKYGNDHYHVSTKIGRKAIL